MASFRTPELKKLALLVALAAPVLALAANYGAIAYSPSTGKFGKSRNHPTRAAAEKAAVADCAAADARALTWAYNGHHCALAVDPGNPAVHGYGSGRTAAQAQASALAECRKRSKNPDGCRVLSCVYSGAPPAGGGTANRCLRCGRGTLPFATYCRSCDVRSR